MAREFWIEHKKFIDEWIYEAYETNEERTNDLPAIHVIEKSAYLQLMAERNDLAIKLQKALAPVPDDNSQTGDQNG